MYTGKIEMLSATRRFILVLAGRAILLTAVTTRRSMCVTRNLDSISLGSASEKRRPAPSSKRNLRKALKNLLDVIIYATYAGSSRY